ncbi:adenosylcobinamide-phosphate synthase CbiB [Halorhabdus sp. BNX81]|uniref:adenosylcobinamide-phosphate synthase CbiB n=1 Tax=Halorhabdus sp. BNX81 TaxID=2980181 RepID=UPI0031F53F9F|nr:Adenosylcobinamide-phosphate synthase [Halorhabdus sp. BNX81]
MREPSPGVGDVTNPVAALGGFTLCVQPAICGALALSLDAIVGEPPETIHPVALFGRMIAPLDRVWPFSRAVGASIALVAPLAVAFLAGWLVEFATTVPVLSSIVAGSVLFSTLSLRRLLTRARDVIAASETDPDKSRERLPALVGRDPTELSPGLIRSASVESLAENLADGFVAPLLAFALGSQLSLSIGIAAAVWVKAVNTLDSMLGYREKPVGWASARLDDLVMWLPARTTAVLIALAARDFGALRRARRWRGAPPSPNSGWPMATLAAALDARLEKPGVYVLNPDATLPDEATATRAIRIVAIAGAISGALSLVIASVQLSPGSLGFVAVGVGSC